MSVNNTYQRIWSKYGPVIALKLKLAISKNEVQEFMLDKFDFASTGGRKNAVFSFSLEYKEGRPINSMNLSTIARDFVAALNENIAAKEMVKTGHFTFKMGNKFNLTIQKN
jgi:hypothetical protein